MTNFFRFLLTLTLFANLISCGNKEEESQQKDQQESTIETGVKEKDTLNYVDYDSIKTTEQSLLRKQKYKRKKDDITQDSVATTNVETKKTGVKVKKNSENKKIDKSTFILKKILNESKIGETLTQKELTENQNIPKDAIKLVKSITKTSEDELDVKWQSTWLVEKVSDAKFKDGKIKLKFKDNTMYTSGNAIGIKYKKKIYTDLVVNGRKVKIPNVKGFYWEIGK